MVSPLSIILSYCSVSYRYYSVVVLNSIIGIVEVCIRNLHNTLAVLVEYMVRQFPFSVRPG